MPQKSVPNDGMLKDIMSFYWPASVQNNILTYHRRENKEDNSTWEYNNVLQRQWIEKGMP